MTAAPSWSPNDQDATSSHGMPATEGGSVAFRNLLGIVSSAPAASAYPAAPSGPAGLSIRPSRISQQFAVGPVSVTVKAATGDVRQRAESDRTVLRKRGYVVGPASPADVAGHAGLACVVSAKNRGGHRGGQAALQKYTIVGPYSVTLTVPLAAAVTERLLGQIVLSPAAPPVITPVVQLRGANTYAVEEKTTITLDWVKLTAVVSAGWVTLSTDEFAMANLSALRAGLPDMAVDNWQPDVFVGGQPCIRDTFLHGVSKSNVVRSEHWWAGVVNGRGIQLFVAATKSIISVDDARPLHDVVVLLPPE